MIKVKDNILLIESNICQYPRVKIYTNLFGNIMLIISPLNWIKKILSSSKEENLLVLLKSIFYL